MDETDVQIRARAFVAKADTSNIQTDLTAYVKEAKAKVREEEMGAGESGMTITKPDGTHIITVNSLETEERQRFTICHEIAHIVLGLESKHDEIAPWSYAKRDQNEVLCDIFAAELLMPVAMWKSTVPVGEPSLEAIEQLAEKFKTSFPAAASRYANLADIPCAFVTMEKGFVRYASRSMSLRQARAWISPRSPIPEGSISRRLKSSGTSGFETGEVAQDIWFENWESGSDLNELARHYPQFDTTIALLWFEADDLPQVEVDRFGARVVDDGGLPELTGELPWPGKSKRKK